MIKPERLDHELAQEGSDTAASVTATKPWTRRILRVGVMFAVVLPLLALFATARYGFGDYGEGTYFMSRPPFLTVLAGPREGFIVQDGFNFVPDRAPHAQAGNFVEFGLPFVAWRVSLRIFSWNWADYEYEGWKSNHAR